MKYIIVILSVIMLSSCEDFFETTLELETPAFESQLVLSAVLNSNETLRKIAITETVSLNEEPLEGFVNNASAQLFYPDGSSYLFDPNNSSDPWYYYNYFTECPEFTQMGTYRLSVSDSKGRTATSEAELPPLVEVLSATYSADGGKDESGNDVSAVDILINDPAGEENYYKIGLNSNRTNSTNSIYLESSDPSISESRNYQHLIVSDAQFDGKQYRLRITFDQYEGERSESFTLLFSSISKDQYKFDKILESAGENQDNPFTTPVQLHTNVVGGLGLFALEQVQEIAVPK